MLGSNGDCENNRNIAVCKMQGVHHREPTTTPEEFAVTDRPLLRRNDAQLELHLIPRERRRTSPHVFPRDVVIRDRDQATLPSLLRAAATFLA